MNKDIKTLTGDLKSGEVGYANRDEFDLTDYYCEQAEGKEYVDECGGHYSLDKKYFRAYLPEEDDVVRDYQISDGTDIVDSSLAVTRVHVGTLTIPQSVRHIVSGNLGDIERIDNIVIYSPYYKCTNGLVLTADGKFVVSNYGNYSQITIPKGVEVIKNCALSGCNATSIIIPESVSVIEDFAFGFCRKLESIVLPKVTEIGEKAFSACYSLRTIDIGNNIHHLGDAAFSGCNSLERIRLVDSTGNETDKGCLHIIETEACDEETGKKYATRILCDDCGGLLFCIDNNPIVKIPEGIDVIHEEAFCEKDNIKSIYIPDSVHSILERAFQDCHNLEKIRLPQGLKRLTAGTFSGCINLHYVNLPHSLEKIETCVWGMSNTARHCEFNLLKLPIGLQSISAHAFSSAKIEKLLIPSTVSYIDEFAFADSYITEIEYYKTI